jgi:hypothetical protein
MHQLRRAYHHLPTLVHDPRTDTLLNVTLHRGGEFRQWSIRVRDVGWDCRMMGPGSIMVCGRPTLETALAQRAQWETEIEAAKTEGWA